MGQFQFFFSLYKCTRAWNEHRIPKRPRGAQLGWHNGRFLGSSPLCNYQLKGVLNYTKGHGQGLNRQRLHFRWVCKECLSDLRSICHTWDCKLGQPWPFKICSGDENRPWTNRSRQVAWNAWKVRTKLYPTVPRSINGNVHTDNPLLKAVYHP